MRTHKLRCNKRYCKKCKKLVASIEMKSGNDGIVIHKCYMTAIASKDDKKNGENQQHKNKNATIGENNGEERDEQEEDIYQLLDVRGEDLDIGANEETIRASEQEAKTAKLVFYDFETTQEKLHKITPNGEVYEHLVNAAHARIVCDACENEDESVKFCVCCGVRKILFIGANALNEFCEWLFEKKNTIALAHNASRFDGVLIMRYLHDNGIKAENVIAKGLSLISYRVGGVKMLDSLAFMPCSLEEMGKTFSINEDGLKKG
jgi:hypothetical protein